MQNIPCDVRAYLRFSIFFLQFRHLKHAAQKAWSPVKMARSSILLAHTLQLYVQLLQMREPSPSRRRFASESRMVPHVLHRKQSICHRLPAGSQSENRSRRVTPMVCSRETYPIQMPCLPRVSVQTPGQTSAGVVFGWGCRYGEGRCGTMTVSRECYVPRRNLCMGRKHHLDPWATRDTLRTIPS